MMRIFIFVIVVISLLSAGVHPVCAAESRATSVVMDFYSSHFATAERMFFTREKVRRVKGWLSPKLYRLMLHELRRAEAVEREYTGINAKKPDISGDVFTNSESPPQVFRLGKSSQRKGIAEVDVWCYWNDQTIGRMKRQVKVQLVFSRGKWLIDNLVYEDGSDLVSMLSRHDYFGG
jgi:hypothetical protein